jgi:hypothetical protein
MALIFGDIGIAGGIGKAWNRDASILVWLDT